ncbi:hypothetical protein M2444_004615 [Paenibacillus sp. PastF-3]|nr:hypothetical protein [Paenibacillus sp. PastF-3]MDH6372786.1 hypothetical protein [Paenibacillus sp. PastF-3]
MNPKDLFSLRLSIPPEKQQGQSSTVRIDAILRNPVRSSGG